MTMTLTEIAQRLDGRNEELSSVVASSLTDAVERRLAEERGFEQCGICGVWGYEVHDDGCCWCEEEVT